MGATGAGAAASDVSVKYALSTSVVRPLADATASVTAAASVAIYQRSVLSFRSDPFLLFLHF